MSELMTEEQRREFRRGANGRFYMENAMFLRLVEHACSKGANQQVIDRVWEDVVRVVTEVAGPNPTPVELMLARSVAADWLLLRTYQGWYHTSQKGLSLPLSEHYQRRIDRTHRRLMGSIKTLATVRRLAIPAVPIQVNATFANVAQQVNATAPAGAIGARPGREESSC